MIRLQGSKSPCLKERPVKRREAIRAILVGGLAGAVTETTPIFLRGTPKVGTPNFVFILMDDLGWSDLGCYGNRFHETPNIDRLAKKGMRFTDAYAACPVCSPTRASILTGKYPARLNLTDWIPGRTPRPSEKLLAPEFNQHLPLEEVTLAEALARAGYVSASIGKWHLGGEPYYPEKQGFALNFRGTARGSVRSYFCLPDEEEAGLCRKGEYITDRLTEEALKFIEANRARPFFLYLPHYAVHLPLEAKQQMVEKYETKLRKLGAKANPTYAAMTESADQGVGRILRKLDELKLSDRTVVIFTSDNGGLRYEQRRTEAVTSNAPLRAGKGHLYEGGIREPLIVRWPGVVEPGSTTSVPVTSTDFFPTLLEIAGVRTLGKEGIDGRSLVALLKQTEAPDRPAIYWHYPHYSNQGGEPGGAIRAGDLKLIEFYEDGRLELYNLNRDIGERDNLATKMPEKAAELRKMLADWRKSVGARMPVANPNFDPSKIDERPTGWFKQHEKRGAD
jgi:arylsulfatase A